MDSKDRFEERVVFQNGKKLLITNRKIMVKKKVFDLQKILNHGIVSNKSGRTVSLIILIIGVLGLALAIVQKIYSLPMPTFMPQSMLPTIEVSINNILPAIQDFSIDLTQERWIYLVSSFLIFVGIALLINAVKKKYKVIIETEKSFTTISKHAKRKQAVKVELAIHEALLYMPPHLHQKNSHENSEFIHS